MDSEAGRLDLLSLVQLVPSSALSPALLLACSLLASGVLLELARAVGEVVTAILSTGCGVELLVFDTFVDLFVFGSGELASTFLLSGLPLVATLLLMLGLGCSRVRLSIVIVTVVTSTCDDIAARFLS